MSKLEEVVCPICGEKNIFDPDNDVILCDSCEAMLDVWREDDGEWGADNL